jgi:hypothetical protein
MGCAFWAVFLQTHMVTLLKSDIIQKESVNGKSGTLHYLCGPGSKILTN